MRAGEWTALAGAVGLFMVLFFNWFGITGRPPLGTSGGGQVVRYADPHLHRTGWASLGWLMVILLCIAVFGGLAITYMTLRRSAPAWPVGAAVLTALVGGIVFLVLLVRVLTQPGLGAGLPSSVVTIQWPAYLGLAFAALIPAGAWNALRDERTEAPESAYTPPPARPVAGT
jgi:hypothetical protein